MRSDLKFRDWRGFTMIELMLVVAILGIVTAIAVPKFADLITKSQESSLKGNLGSIRSAIVIYYSAAEGYYPNNITDLAPLSGTVYLAEVPIGTIPAVAKQSNPGHEASDEVELGDGTNPDDEAGGEVWYYVNTGANTGLVFVNCTHRGTSGTVWTEN